MPENIHSLASVKPVEPVYVTGDALRAALRGKSAPDRARIAARLASGSHILIEPLASQVAKLCNVDGRTLGKGGRRGVRPGTIDKVIRKYGLDAILRGCDRAITPTMQAAE
jgi:hypothetical protein